MTFLVYDKKSTDKTETTNKVVINFFLYFSSWICIRKITVKKIVIVYKTFSCKDRISYNDGFI